MKATLSESKQAILQQRLRAAHAAVAMPGQRAQTIPVGARTEARPLSFMQQQLWFLDRLVPQSAAYNVFEAVRIKGPGLSIPALERSLTVIVQRHEVLRSTFTNRDGHVVQMVRPASPFHLAFDDLRAAEDREGEADRLARQEAQKPFDLECDLMLRARLLRLADDDHLLLLNMHHIAADGWSLGVLYRELSLLYQAESEGRMASLLPLPIQFSDFADWQRGKKESARLQEQLAYWRGKLAGAPDLVEIPRDRPRPTQPTFRGALEWFTVPDVVVERLRELARGENATLFMVLTAAFKTLLHRYTGQTDIVVGSTVAGRDFWETEGVVGPFINALPLRSDLSGNPSFRTLLRSAKGTVLDAYANQDVSLELLVQEVKGKRSVPHLPLFQTMLIMQSVPTHGFDVAGFTSRRTEVDNGTAKFDLTLSMTETAEGLTTACEYSTDLFEANTIRRWIRHFQMLLKGIAENPELPLSEIPLLDAAEHHQVVVEWNQTATAEVETRTVVELFEAQCARRPDRPALRCGNTELTYRQLEERANQVAGYLSGRGVGPENLVGVCMQRSIDLVVAILGILKAGGAYVPMDANYPAERIGYIARDSGLSLILTDGSVDLHSVSAPRVSVNDLEAASGGRESQAARPENLAYVIYTSGSTGRPKGVAVEHRSLSAFLQWARRHYSELELEGVLFATSVCFDLSVFEMFAPLTAGGKVIVASNGIEWLSAPEAAEVTLVNTVPSVAREWLRMGQFPGQVRTINLAGEPLPQGVVDQLYASLPGVQKIYDLYGPTEDTVYSTCALRTAGGQATIGRPIENKQIYLLDAGLRPVAIGLPGDLYIGGAGLAREYLNQPELTAGRFIANPFISSGRLYKSGDLARFRPDGNIEFLGRADHQVKIRGFRIELGEIEARLLEHPGVAEAAVAPVDDAATGQRLVAYLILKPGCPPDAGELRSFLKRSLPDYMVPAAFMCLPAFPLTPNGKVDRKALPLPPLESQTAAELRPPRTPTEEELSRIWREVLKLEAVGVDQDFFALGGHSILALQVIARVRETFGCEVPVRRLFDSPTITDLAAAIGRTVLEEVEGLTDEEAERLSGNLAGVQP